MNRIPTLLETRPTLLVVGLQEEPLTETKCFPALPDIIRAYTANVERIIRERARAAHQIVFAEVPGAGPTMPRFLAAAAETATVVMPARRHGSPQELENIDTGSICCALSPLVGSRAGVEVIGINAGASVADAALALSDTGYLVRVLGDGILNHYAWMPVDQWEYWGYNDLGELRLTAYSDYPHDAALLDVSALGKDTNLVKAHLRLYREQGGSLAA